MFISACFVRFAASLFAPAFFSSRPAVAPMGNSQEESWTVSEQRLAHVTHLLTLFKTHVVDSAKATDVIGTAICAQHVRRIAFFSLEVVMYLLVRVGRCAGVSILRAPLTCPVA